MNPTIFLAQAFGLYFTIMAIALLVQRKDYLRIVRHMVRDDALMLTSGVFTLMIGIILILVHNVWEGPWQVVLVTIVAWLTFAKGVIRVLFPHHLRSIIKTFENPSNYMVASAATLVMGLILLQFGFFF